jgi:hypothetical protein
VNTNPAAIHAAVCGWGITRVLSYQVAAEVASGALNILMKDYEPEPWPVYVDTNELIAGPKNGVDAGGFHTQIGPKFNPEINGKTREKPLF